MEEETNVLINIRNQMLKTERILDPDSMFYNDFYLIDEHDDLVGLYAKIPGEKNILVYYGDRNEVRDELEKTSVRHGLSYRCLKYKDPDEERIYFKLDGIDAISFYKKGQPMFEFMIHPLPKPNFPESGHFTEITGDKHLYSDPQG